MSRRLERLAKLREQIAKLKQQVPSAAQLIRTAKAALPSVADPVAKARQALEGLGAAAQQQAASLQQDIEDISRSFPDINKTVADATALLSVGEQGLKDALAEKVAAAQQGLLAKVQGSLPTTALTDAQKKIEEIKAKLDKSKDLVAKLPSVSAMAAQVPQLSDLVGKTLQSVSGIQNPVAQALGVLTGAAGQPMDPADVAAKLAKVQQQATAIGAHISSVSGLMSKGAAAVPGVQQRMDQVQKLIAGAASGDTFANLSSLVEGAIGESGISDEIAAASAKFAEFSSMGDQGMALLGELAGGNLPADLKDKVGQIRGSLDQALKQMPGASSLVANIAKQTGDISGQVKKAKDVLGDITKLVGGPPAEKVAKLQEHVQLLQQQFGSVTKTLSSASSAMPDLEKKFAQATQLLSGGGFQQFQDLIGGMSSSSDAISALAGGNLAAGLQGHLGNAQQALNDILGGQIPESAKGAVSQLQALLGDTTKQLPGLSAMISQAGGGVGDISKHLESAKKLAASFSPDILKQAGAASQLTNLLGSATAQFPAASQAISQLTGSLPQMQQSIGKAQQLFSDITSGKVNAGAALQQLAGTPAVAQFLQQAQEMSGVSNLIAQHAASLPGLQQHMSQAASLMQGLQSGSFSSAELGQALADMKGSVANAAKNELSKHLSAALGSSGALGANLSTLQAAIGQIQGGQLPAAAQQLLGSLTSSLGDVGSQITSISSSMSTAASTVGNLASQLQNAQGGVAGLTEVFAQQLGQSAQLGNLMAAAQAQFPAAAALVNQAATALPQLQEKFAQGQQLLTGVMSGTVSPQDLLAQLSASPEMQGVMAAAQAQFPAAAGLLAQANQMLPQLQQGLDSAKNVAAALQSGDLTSAMGALQSSPQVQALLGQAAAQFPEAAAALQQAQAVAAQVQEGIGQAQGALTALQAGDYQAALGAVAGIPAVQNALAAAQAQFPQAAALVGQAQAALPQIQAGLAQANQAMAAMQSGDYAGALAQLQTMPAVQNLLAAAQAQFPEAAALAAQAQEGLAAAQAGLAQADQLVTAFKNGDTAAALAQLQSIPAVQNALAAAQAQFPEAAAALTTAAAVLPQVQAHLDQASAMIDAAVAGDLTQLPVALAAVGVATTSVAAAEATQEAAAEDAAAATSSSSSSASSSSSSASSSSSSSASSSESSSSSGAAAVVEDAPPAAEEAEDSEEGEVLLTISTPLEKEFVVVNMRGDEQMSGLFTYRVEVTTQDEDIDFTTIVGESVTIYLDLGEDEPRNINGIVTRITQGSTDDDDNTIYVLEVRPWLWKLTKAADCRIYQAMSAVDIITGIFDELGFTDYTNSTTGTYTARDYCVQYRETAFNFISRLMEEEGIYYFFTHEDGKHTLILADDSDAYPDCHVPEIEFDPTDTAFEDEIFKATLEQSYATAKYLMDDFHFETSATDLLATADGEGMSWYEYPGGFTTTDAGNAIATRRLAAIEAGTKVMRGSSLVKTLVAGCKFTLSQHVRESMNAAWVVRRVSMKCDQQKYTDTFEAIPATVVFRPPLVTPKPIIHGSQTAMVVGKSGEEIWVDKYGRVKVQFHWDQKGKKDENSSCWVRCSQGWAGKTWGMVFLPRIGDEVVVSFLEGNPDRPLITGSVYNAQSTVPYTLPDDQTKSTIKTRSSKAGTAGNEIRFQDLKDSEEFYLHAQKDMKHLVEHDWVKHVKNSEQTFVQADDPTAETDFKHVLVVDGKRKVLIKGDANEETHTNEGKFTQAVTKEFTLTVDGDTLTITAKGDLKITGKTVTIESSSGDVTIKSAANLKAEASSALSTKSGTTLTNEAGTALSNKSGTELKNEAGTALSNKAGLELKNEGLTITNKASASQECDGGGMLTLKGGMVKLN